MKTIAPLHIKRFLLAASVALAVPIGAYAHGGNHGGLGTCQGMQGDMVPHHLQVLGLSEVQRDKVFEIMHAQAPAMRAKAKAVRKAEEDLRALSASGDYSDVKAKALADASAKAHAEMSLALAKLDHQVFDLLTPEQRQQFAELKAQPPHAHGAHHGPHGMGDAKRPPEPATR